MKYIAYAQVTLTTPDDTRRAVLDAQGSTPDIAIARLRKRGHRAGYTRPDTQGRIEVCALRDNRISTRRYASIQY